MKKINKKKELKRIFSSSCLFSPTSINVSKNNNTLTPNGSTLNISKPIEISNFSSLSPIERKRTKLVRINHEFFSPRRGVLTKMALTNRNKINPLSYANNKEDKSSTSANTITVKNDYRRNNIKMFSKLNQFKANSGQLDYFSISTNNNNSYKLSIQIKKKKLPKLELKEEKIEFVPISNRLYNIDNDKWITKLKLSEGIVNSNLYIKNQMLEGALSYMKRKKEKEVNKQVTDNFYIEQMKKVYSHLENIKNNIIPSFLQDTHILPIIFTTKLKHSLFYYFYAHLYSIEFDFCYLSYISYTYFDCYHELLQIVDPKDDINRYANIFKKIRDEIERKEKYKENKESLLDIINLEYADKFFKQENKNEFNAYNSEISSPVLSPIMKKIKGSRKQSSFYGKSNWSLKRKNSTLIRHQLTSKKVTQFNVLKDKNILNRNKSSININAKSDDPELGILLKKKIEKVKIPLKKDINLTSKNFIEGIYNYLFTCCSKNQTKEFIQTFEEFNTILNVNKVDQDKNSFLIIATKNNSVEICEYILNRGCDVNYQNQYDNTALHYAVSFKYFTIINLLLKFKADEMVKNINGNTPWECTNGNCENEE